VGKEPFFFSPLYPPVAPIHWLLKQSVRQRPFGRFGQMLDVAAEVRHNSRWSRLDSLSTFRARRTVMSSAFRLAVAVAAVLAAHQSAFLQAQNGAQPAQVGNQPKLNAAVGDGAFGIPGAQQGFPGQGVNGAEGGSAMADFDSLIDLITATVERESWIENGTGEGDIQPFAINGVYVDAAGALRMREGAAPTSLASVRSRGLRPATTGAAAAASQPTKTSNPLANVAKSGEAPQSANANAARTASPLRYISLSRLEAAIADCQRRHAPLEPAMLTLAGLQRVEYVLVYPETGDLVLAGPAGDWQAAVGGGLISLETGRPVVRLDDLLALWRRQRSERSAAFGCSIVPRQEALARTQEFLAASAAKPLEPGQRRTWLKQLRDTLGVQDVAYFNIDPDTRIGSLLLAADYHMKLIGMGLAEGVPGVKSYLASVRLGPNGEAPAMSVLRWWFSMPASTVEAAPERDAFALPERCVVVLSENELLAARGERVHTGQSDDLNRAFAESFTKEFASLSNKYPVYGELERVFELALSLALIEREGLTEKVGWTPTLLVDETRLRLPQVASPRAVETVINHRVIGGRQIIAGISGGVWVDGGKSLSVTPAAAEVSGKLASAKKVHAAQPQDLAWWWD
jgi:hypothetical protein